MQPNLILIFKAGPVKPVFVTTREKVTNYKLLVTYTFTKMTKAHRHNKMSRVQQPRPFNNVAYGPYIQNRKVTGNASAYIECSFSKHYARSLGQLNQFPH